MPTFFKRLTAGLFLAVLLLGAQSARAEVITQTMWRLLGGNIHPVNSSVDLGSYSQPISDIYAGTIHASSTDFTNLTVNFSSTATTSIPKLWANMFQAGLYAEMPYFMATSTTATSTIANSLTMGNTTSGFFWDGFLGRLSLGADDKQLNIDGTTYGNSFSVHKDGSTDLAEVSLERHSDTAGFGSHLILTRSGGTEASETTVANGYYLSRIDSIGHNGTNYSIGTQIDSVVDGIVSATSMPARFGFFTTPTNSVTPLERLRITSGGNVGIATTSPFARLTVDVGAILNTEITLATSTTMTVNFATSTSQLLKIGTAATTVVFDKYLPGQSLVLTVCNPGAAAGALTFPMSNIIWAGGSMPTQTTTANKCEDWVFKVSNGTSTAIIKGSQITY